MHKQGQGAQEIRVRQQGVGCALALGTHPRRTVVPQRVRRAHDRQEPGAGQAHQRQRAETAGRRQGLPRQEKVRCDRDTDPRHTEGHRLVLQKA